MLILRRIIFILFSLAYLICCPLIILYALGINLNPHGTQNITKTGIIPLATQPSEATVYLDHLRYPQKTPTVIRNLVPGEYSLKLVLKGYQTWEKIVPVKAETATVLENILLIPQTWPTPILSYLSFEDIIPIQDNSFFLLKRGPLVGDFFIFRISEKFSEQILPALESRDNKGIPLASLFPADTIYNQAKVLSLFTMPESTSALFQVGLKGAEKFLWIDLKPKPVIIDDITDLMIKKPKKLFWDRRDNKNIFVYQDDALSRLETATKAIYPHIAEHIRGLGLYNQKLYILSPDHVLRKLGYDGKDQEFILPDRSLILSHFGESAKYQIQVFPDNLILFLGEHGELLTNRVPFHLIDKDIKGFEFDEASQRLLVWTDHNLGVIDFSLNNQKQDLKPTPKVIWLLNGAKEIQQAFWVNRASYFVLRDQDKIVLGETEKFNAPVAQELFKVKKNSSVVYSEITGKLYYLDPQNHNLYAQTIVPVQDLFSFTNRKEKEFE